MNKLQPKGFYECLLDYDSQSKGYIIYHDQKVFIKRNLQFIDKSQIAEEKNKQNKNSHDQTRKQIDVGNDERRKSERQTRPTKRSRGLNYDESKSDIALYLSEFNEFANEIQNDPLNIHEALSRNDKLEWIKVMNEEIQSLKSRNT